MIQMKPEQLIVEQAYWLALSVPQETIESAISVILNAQESRLQSEIFTRIPHHQHREMLLSFIERWKSDAKEIEANSVAIALRMAAHSQQIQRNSGSTELVWTGPHTTKIPFRFTEQAILEIIESARHRIILVSFAVYKIPNIAKALINAAKRGITLTVIVETPNLIEGEGEYNTIQALGDEIANCSSIYYWPEENRQIGENGKPGILHVKCVVADAHRMILSSANMTRQAFTVNMELGVMIRGGDLPGTVDRQFRSLIDSGHLKMVCHH